MIPPLPSPLDGAAVLGSLSPRYEDVDQDGHLRLVAIPPSLGAVLWPAVLTHPDSQAQALTGVIPILSRMVLEVHGGPLSALQPMRAEAAWHRDAVTGPDGAPQRLMLMMWVDLYARQGWTLLPPEPGAPELLVGRIYAEHTFTRLFAGPGERRVTELPGWSPRGGWPDRRAEEVAPDPDGAPEQIREHSFGLTHTDPNAHVNSLVYPRIFEEGAILLRGDPSAARSMEVMWRKPFFAGETAFLHQWRGPGEQVFGRFVDASGGVRARMRMVFGPNLEDR